MTKLSEIRLSNFVVRLVETTISKKMADSVGVPRVDRNGFEILFGRIYDEVKGRPLYLIDDVERS